MLLRNSVFIFFVSVLVVACSPATEVIKLQLIPQPEEVYSQKGKFCLSEKTLLEVSDNKEEKNCAEILQTLISGKTGYQLVTSGKKMRVIRLQIDSLLSGNKEGYTLEITQEKINIRARTATGLFYGTQTLAQLLIDKQFYNHNQQTWQLPALKIEDKPAFPYRGLHLDVSRHFYPKEFIMKCLDLMAKYKLNRLHWHLTDAAGWRVEIKQYPELTTRGAWRTKANYMEWWNGDRHYATAQTEGAYGGFYTQEEIRSIVAYAEKRHITVIPEIEMPGHSEEVVSIYPQLGCYGQPYRNGEFCIGNEETFVFIENVLNEIVELFPSEYIHIGGDEASTAAWKKCPKCQKRIKDNNLKDEKELQSYMIRRASKILEAKGRKLIGWDEILDGGLAEDATVMSWRGESGGIKAARMGHDVVMTPGSHCYFDSYQADPRTQPQAIGGFLPYLKVYSYHPVPAELTEEEGRHILGAQANVWAEYIQTPAHAEYMIFPRLLALSEVVWSPKEKKEPEDFKRRIAKHIEYLQEWGVNVFTLSDRIEIFTEIDTLTRQIKIRFDSEKYQPEIHYTINDGREIRYKEPFYVTDSVNIKAFIVRDGKAGSEVLNVREDYHRAIGKPVSYRNNSYYSSSYPAAKESTLTDGYRGGLTYGDGKWQGFLTHIDVVVDMREETDLSYVSANFMQLIGPGVYMPDYVAVSISSDGETFREIARINNRVPVDEKDLVIKDFTARFQAKGRYVRLFARKHAGFQFIDEIVIY